MNADILDKEAILEVLWEAGFSETDINDIEATLTALEESEGIPPLGYTINSDRCEACGHVQGSIHPIPMKYPCECDLCGQMTCYYHELPPKKPEDLF